MSTQSAGLERFVRAQERDYARALRELVAGKKQTHWIWYILPQLRGLGHSQMAREFGIADRKEAADYLAHPTLGPRLVACVNAILRHTDRDADEVLGDIDATKFRSCLTLFATIAPDERCFTSALTAFYQGKPDPETLRLLGLQHGED
ncbi:MAG TPA: DUF1810 domain-containing protein [Acidobacteriaceae bacterium]